MCSEQRVGMYGLCEGWLLKQCVDGIWSGTFVRNLLFQDEVDDMCRSEVLRIQPTSRGTEPLDSDTLNLWTASTYPVTLGVSGSLCRARPDISKGKYHSSARSTAYPDHSTYDTSGRQNLLWLVLTDTQLDQSRPTVTLREAMQLVHVLDSCGVMCVAQRICGQSLGQ